MTTTPATHRRIAVESIALPTDLTVTDSVISWTESKRRVEELTEEDMRAMGTDALLDDFLALASGDPADMGAFMARHGVLSLCGKHGLPALHQGNDYCPLLEVAGRPGVSVQTVRRAARAFVDLAQWGQSVRAGLKPPPRSGIDTQRLLGPSFPMGKSEAIERDRIAQHLTTLNRQAGVRPLVTWDKRVSFTFAADGLLGVLAILLTREIAARSDLTYTCSACGALVARGRPPQPDEAIYCPKASCRREQRRRNQAAWRARSRAEGKS